jgi:hypothetical protein
VAAPLIKEIVMNHPGIPPRFFGRRAGVLSLAVAAVIAGCAPPPDEPAPPPAEATTQELRTENSFQFGQSGSIWKAAYPQGVEVLCGIQAATNLNQTLINGLRFRYCDDIAGTSRQTQFLSGTGGSVKPEFFMGLGETLVRVEANTGALFDSIKFVTNLGRTYGPFGGPGGQFQFFNTPTMTSNGERRQIEGFVLATNNSDQLMSVTVLHYLPRNSQGSTNVVPESHVLAGGSGGTATFVFTPQGDEDLQAVHVKTIWANGFCQRVGGIQLGYRSRSSGAIRLTGWAGTPLSPGNSSAIRVDQLSLNAPSEILTRVQGSSGQRIDHINMISNLGRSTGVPFCGGGLPFSFGTRIHGGLTRQIIGFEVVFNANATEIKSIKPIDSYGRNGHLACQQGPQMVGVNDPCVQQICNADSFCCDSGWDGACVNQVESVCNLTCMD